MESLRETSINPLVRPHEHVDKGSACATVIEKLETLKLYPSAGGQEISQSTPKVLTVAISGCSSSGKTTLALLLSEIFSPLSIAEDTANSSPLDDEKCNLNNSQATASPTSPFTTTIHQDAFFIPKAQCPFVEFKSAHTDKSFMEESVAKIDENPVYFYSSNGVKGEGNVRVIGPNTDCMESVDFGNLLRKVQSAKNGNVEPEKDAKFKDDADKKKLAQQYSGVITNMRERVKEHLASATIINGSGNGGDTVEYIDGWVFVEGFLLFSKSMPSDELFSELDELDEELYAEIAEALQPNVKEELELIGREMKRMREEIIPSKETLMQEFDIKLFLPTSKEVAKHRRMSRFPYVDFPTGGRHPGQMWKSEGYFDEVAWKGYEDSFDWLLKESGKEIVNGVFVRTTFDDTVENTVEWAVDTILETLSSRGNNKNGIGKLCS